MKIASSLRRLQSHFRVVSSPELSSSVHWTPTESFPVHRWFRYREGFSPNLFDFFPEAKYRFDPFCGCGTTLLESARRGVQSFGIDLNPLATFVTKVKTRPYSSFERARFMKLSAEALSAIKAIAPSPKPNFNLLHKIFLQESLDTLLRLRAFIELTPPGKLQSLLLLAWLSILETASNVFKEGNGLKYRNKRRKPGRYETVPDNIWIPKHFGGDIRGFVKGLWSAKCSQISEDIARFSFTSGFTPEVRTGSCLDRNSLNFGREFDFVVFSPPYANRFDYFEAFKIELWMGGFVKARADMLSLRAKSIRNNLTAERFRPGAGWPPLTPYLEAMDCRASSVRMGIKPTLEGYFHDMRMLLRNLKQAISKRATVVIVVGNSAYAKSMIPTDLLIAKLGLEEGYSVNCIRIARHLHVSSQQRSSLGNLQEFMRESVVILKK